MTETLSPMSVMKKVETASQLDLLPVDFRAPIYKYRRCIQQAGSTALTLSSSTTQSIFSITGNNVWNFARSFITVDNIYPDVNLSYNYAQIDCAPIDRIQLTTDDGKILVDIPNAQIYTKVSQPLSLSREDFYSRGPVYGASTILTRISESPAVGCQPSILNVTAATTVANHVSAQLIAAAGATSVLPSDAYLVTAGAANQNAAVASVVPISAVSGNDLGGRGPQHYVNGLIGDGAGAGDLAVRYKFNFGELFKGSLLAMDKDLMFPVNLQLVIYWKPLSGWGFSALANLGTTASIASATSSNYYLYMCSDINEQNVNEQRASLMSGGYSIYTPYITMQQQTSSTSTGSFAASYNLTPGQGQLKRVICVPSVENAPKGNAQNYNVGGIVVSSVQSFLDAKPIQDLPLTVTAGETWNYLYEHIKGSVLGLSARTYLEHFCWVDNFSDAGRSLDYGENDCKESGLIIDVAKNYRIELYKNIATAQITASLFFVWLKKLDIKPGMVSWASNL